MAPNIMQQALNDIDTTGASNASENNNTNGDNTTTNLNPPSASADYYRKGADEAATDKLSAYIHHRIRLTERNDRLVIVLVGLPARGKSFIARKLLNFVTWRGSECRVFNVGKYRRWAAEGVCDAAFFDSKNENAAALRQQVASLAMDDMLQWLDHEDEGSNDTPTTERKDRIGIFDATNSTKERRDWVLKECTRGIKRSGKPTGVVFVESICDDKDLLHENFMTKVNNSPDYKGIDVKVAMADLISRVKKYEEAYETIEDDTQSYIKIYNLSSKMLVNHIYGRMAKSIVPALMAWNIGTRPVFICRAGQTRNGSERLSANKSLSRSEGLGRRGKAFRDALFGFVKVECLDFIGRRQKAAFSPDLDTGTSISGVMNQGLGSVVPTGEEDNYFGADGVTPLPFPCHMMTSTMPRARQTIEWDKMPYCVDMLSNLNPLDKGDFQGYELEELAEVHPEWYSQLAADPFYTRFPGGECYGDLTSRLESVVVDIEQQVGPVLVVSHVSVLQVLVAYFRNTPVEDCTSIALPLNTVLKFTPGKGGGWHESQHLILDSPSDLASMDNSMHYPEGTCTPLAGTPASQLSSFNNKDKGSPPDIISPVAAPPIWGDH